MAVEVRLSGKAIGTVTVTSSAAKAGAVSAARIKAQPSSFMKDPLKLFAAGYVRREPRFLARPRVSKKCLPYIAEAQFKYNNRKTPTFGAATADL